MAKWRTKPQVKEAEQWFPGKVVPGVLFERDGGCDPRPYVVTIHCQRAYLEPGDYVVTEPDGTHHYPCKPDIWEDRHERIE